MTLTEVDPWTMEITYEGNLESLTAYEGIYIEDVGVLSPFFIVLEGGVFGTMGETISMHISPVSDRYSFLFNFK
ncbi:MAG: hypothetical protein K2H76_07260 [Muribaculaceae bacterium]|nr:hypothetical protein [Muribaculaceae bacterium]MDE6026736.1 hypothetical protein [Muribaculaceae bacterium]